MESAIPPHLQCPRLRHRRVPDEYVPPYPGFVARYDPAVTRVVMAYFGIQYGADRVPADRALCDLARAFATDGGPAHWDRAHWVDERGANNLQVAAYWTEPARFDAWFPAHGQDWARVPRAGIGTFLEIVKPGIERFETVYGHRSRSEGIGVLAASISGDVMEHAYWGAARDRFPASQVDALHSTDDPVLMRDGAHVTVRAPQALCLIRSGQDWGDTADDERAMYVDDMEPILRRGMEFLRDDGRAVGCYSNRYATIEDSSGRLIEKSYGMSWWKNLAALERWAESHPTHIAIFASAINYFTTLGKRASLRLYHEVSVTGPDDQHFEYLNCHDGTGLLRAG